MISEDPLAALRTPKLHVKVVDCLTEDDVRLLIRACPGKELRDRRDEAIVRLMAETGMRAGEVLNMRPQDIDLTRGLVAVHRTKTGRGRVVPFGPHTARAIDRWVRMRQHQPLAAGDKLWLGDRGRTISYHGLRSAIMGRAAAAGLNGFHLHELRHTAASRWLAAGGSEGGAMSAMGWTNPKMLHQYVAATAAERAAAEARSLDLGNIRKHPRVRWNTL